MAEKITIEGKADDKDLPADIKTKVHDALKNALQQEIQKASKVVTTRHFSVTHGSVVFS